MLAPSFSRKTPIRTFLDQSKTKVICGAAFVPAAVTGDDGRRRFDRIHHRNLGELATLARAATSGTRSRL
jgi:hypothetical protein